MGLLDLLDADGTTVLFAFHDSTGAANPGTVKTKVAAPIDLGTLDTEITVHRSSAAGGTRGRLADPPVEFTLPLLASATTYDNLTTGLGQLARWLRDPPGPLRWTVGATVRYIDLLGTPTLPALLRGQGTAGLVSTRASSLGPIPITMLRQPYLRGAEVTIGPTNVPNDPASTNGRALSVSISGDLPTPVKLKATMDTGSAVERVLVAHHTTRGLRNATALADYQGAGGTRYMQCEATGGGWTIALGTNTTATTDSNASPGSGNTIARCTHATDPTVFRRAVRGTRTANLDSLRGPWDVWGRVKNSAAADHRLKLGWGISTADAVANFNPEATHDTSVTPPAFGYVEKYLGHVYIPEDVPLSGLALEVHTRRASGTGNLDMDHLWLVSRDGQGTVVVGGGTGSTMLGKDLTTPPFKLTADPTWVAGAVVGDVMRLNAVNEAAGMGPNAGTDLPDGRNRFSFAVTWTGNAVIGWKARVVNVTDNTEVVSEANPSGVAGGAVQVLSFDAVAAKLYQGEVVITTYVSGSLDVMSIAQEFVPSLALNESLRTDPGTRYTTDRLDSSGNLTGTLGTEGEVPLVLQPGTNIVSLRADEVALALYDENENKRTRTLAVSGIYSPRYAL